MRHSAIRGVEGGEGLMKGGEGEVAELLGKGVSVFWV